ncbi:hypothetical protein [Nesterenkonia pannonica]|nr:hypothetical protein [Nesterenkonia pannonica]
MAVGPHAEQVDGEFGERKAIAASCRSVRLKLLRVHLSSGLWVGGVL